MSTILAIPTEKDVLEISTDEDWVETIDFFQLGNDNTTEVARDFTGCTIAGAIVLKNTKGGEVARLNVSTADGTISVQGNAVTISRLRSVVQALPAGLYDFGLTVTDANGNEEGLIRGKRQVVQGVLV